MAVWLSLRITTFEKDDDRQINSFRAVAIALSSPSKDVWFGPNVKYLENILEWIPAPVGPFLSIWEPSV